MTQTEEQQNSSLVRRSGGIPGLVILIAIVLSLIGAFYLKQRADSRVQTKEVTTQVAEKVNAENIQLVSVPVLVKARGFLSGYQEVMINSEVSGRVQKIAEPGRTIEKGQPLCQIDETFYRIAVQKAEANLETSEGQLQEAEAAVEASLAAVKQAEATQENARIEYERCLKLHESKNAVQIELDRYRTRYESANAALTRTQASLAGSKQRLTTAAAAIDAAKATLAQAQEQLSRCSLLSPITGRIDRKYIDESEYAVAGAPIAEIIELDRMKMNIELSGQEVSLVRDATKINVKVDAISGKEYTATLDHIAPKADPVTRKFRVELHVDNPENRILSGMFGEVQITCRTLQDVILVHRDSLVSRFAGDFVFCIENTPEGTIAKLNPVQTAPIPGRPESRHIVKGLKPGQQIIPTPPTRLIDGSPVTIDSGSR